MVWMEIGGHAHDTPVRSCDFVRHRQAALENGISNKTKGISPKKKKLNRNLVSGLYYEWLYFSFSLYTSLYIASLKAN